MNLDVCFSSNTDNWRTPSNLYNLFINNGYLDLFPFNCSYDQFHILYMFEKLYINPPFSRLKDLPSYIGNLITLKNRIFLLMPSRTDTIYFHELLQFNPKIYFLKGRLHFNDSVKSAPFPTIILEFNDFDHCEYCIWSNEVLK